MMQTKRMLAAGAMVLMIAGALFMTGCGGGGGGTIDSGNGSLTAGDMFFNSGQYADLRRFTTRQDAYVVVEMKRTSGNSSISDPAVRVVYGHSTTAAAYNNSLNAYGYAATNDDGGDGPNARAVFYASRDEDFTAAFTSFASGDTGDYSWRIYQTDSPPSPSPTAVHPDATVKKAPIAQSKNDEFMAH